MENVCTNFCKTHPHPQAIACEGGCRLGRSVSMFYEHFAVVSVKLLLPQFLLSGVASPGYDWL